MVKANLSTKMGTASKAITLKTKREEKASTYLTKEEYCNPSLTQILLKFPRFT